MQAGHSTRDNCVKCKKKKMTFFKIFKFPAGGGGGARTSRRHRDRTQKPDAGIGRRR
ncbi:unnamed protein product [Staurois parvus]|uniref:Uncharacterized protein n=1 Tax=Staurois parvus TaxID=386267 RepID=A0ABN9AYU6_9NEOB|nr:unnamed protein product [Staurois parvus]